MKDKKGQALIEFVIILPILIFIVFIIIDFGTTIYERNKLENTISDIVNLYKEKQELDRKDVYNLTNDKTIKFDLIRNDEYVTIKVSKKINIITPLAKNVLNDIDNIYTKRVIYVK